MRRNRHLVPLALALALGCESSDTAGSTDTVADSLSGQDGQGDTSPDGADASDGVSAGDAVDATDSADATDGAVGTDGIDGAAGTDGTDGTDTADGADGTNGTDTADGADGTNGTDTADGTDGSTGSPSGCYEGVFLDVSKSAGAGDGYAKPTLTVTCTDTTLTVESNGIPHYTFVPITPNALVVSNHKWQITRTPELAAQTTAIPLLGTIAFSVNGQSIFGPNEGAQPAAEAYGDPVYNGIMDGCLGHTAFEYHYHALLQQCLDEASLVSEPWNNEAPATDKASPILGFALDGFPIYGSYGCLDAACAQVVEFKSGYQKVGDPTKNAWDAYQYQASDDPTVLDKCNGRIGPDGTYRYYATTAFPYVLGCYSGTPGDTGAGGADGGAAGTDGVDAPPDGADGVDAPSCTSNADCTNACPDGAVGCTCATTPMGQRCIPTCNTATDCPVGPGGQTMNCSPQKTCVPAGAPG